ncbi:YnfU family zinc-binding protein [Cronobacter sakazakii]|nr:YnfU family zinc-binding protein [Cronobacter sakazakii]MDQ9188263.1 YnfU family zinc-binding protein [Cronobacter sakazakii]MDQ9193098.1 YnfU family zinc-binding protein [Cronobacter sakazakii]MDQ9204343.1 YnfU family zinc-binding protein [Cronobacter sakazakii]
MAIHKRKSQDSYLSRVTCPKCNEKSEHSAARVNKQKNAHLPRLQSFICLRADSSASTLKPV